MAKVKLEILEPAQKEIEEIIAVYYQLAGHDSSLRLYNKIYDALDRLLLFPLSAPLLQDKELKIAGYRMLVVEDYLCIYRFLDNVIYIYHIVHGKSNYPKIFKSFKY